MSRAGSGSGVSGEGLAGTPELPRWGSASWCAELAARWAGGLVRTCYVPMSRGELEERTHALVERLVEALGDPTLAERAGRSVGEQLVRLNATGEESLTWTLELLCDALLPQRTEETRDVVGLLAAVAAGYTEARQASTLDQQETLRRALLRTKLDTDRRLRVSEDRFREIFRNTPVGMGICDLEGTFLDVNDALKDTLGYSERELLSLRLDQLFPAGQTDVVSGAYADLLRGARSGLRERCDLRRADGGTAWTYVALSGLRDENGEPTRFVVMVEDLRELSYLQERLRHQTLHDSVTGLPNRQHFWSRLETALAGSPAEDRLTLYQLRLDGFGLINEGLGYETGDAIVRAVANRLQRLVEGEDGLVARIGGTQFAVLVRQGPHTPGVAEFAELINRELDEPIYIGENGLAPTASIGVIQRAVGDREPADMMWAAEVALRNAEQAGKRQWALFDPDRAPLERSDSKLAATMPGALELGEFEVRYRPLVSLPEERITGVEARLSWQPPDHDELGHEECLRLAERSGITLSLRDWMLETAWRQLEQWHERGLCPQLVVGLSPNQSRDPDLVGTVRRTVGSGTLAADRLRLCVSMGALMRSGGEARDNLDTLAATGVRTAAHEFRASPAELRFLREHPTQAVLLSPELVRLVDDDAGEESPEFRALCGTIPLVREQGIPVAVPEVRTARQARWWYEAGCEIAAGEYYGVPLDAGAMGELLALRVCGSVGAERP
ncbi:putative bifunctional diguanylate cyclase/phosphodiesterase [Actinopolyspora mortivallis]|uniref:putative bifunctional diguanylate cyclase/phosphodiesterase n=1 Tax=Actinopolyspora mortivallis TaxID=33906 RepID=UPI00039C0C8A|nr:EAL domain-containing protein [Actinopolyspora mortivallis]